MNVQFLRHRDHYVCGKLQERILSTHSATVNESLLRVVHSKIKIKS